MEKLKNEYKKVFGKYEIPETLQQLMDFESKHNYVYYSEGFELRTSFNKTPDMGQYSLDEAYFERLLVFAMADNSGADYAFWVSEVGMSLEDAPIIVIGSEGEFHVVAKNIKDLLKLLSFGPEVANGKYYIIPKFYEKPEDADLFREWMVNELKVQPINQKKIVVSEEDNRLMVSEEVDTIVKEAIKEYGGPFRDWMMSLTPQYVGYDE